MPDGSTAAPPLEGASCRGQPALAHHPGESEVTGIVSVTWVKAYQRQVSGIIGERENMARSILILGASYGSLLATKLLMAGHDVTLVCRKNAAELDTCRARSRMVGIVGGWIV